MAESKHDKVAGKIAKKEGTEYNRGHQKPVYVVPTEKKAIPDAVKRYKKTTIGVMAPSGKVVKRSTRGRKK